MRISTQNSEEPKKHDLTLRGAKLVMGVDINQLRKISLKLQVSTLLTYMLGFIVLKLRNG